MCAHFEQPLNLFRSHVGPSTVRAHASHSFCGRAMHLKKLAMASQHEAQAGLALEQIRNAILENPVLSNTDKMLELKSFMFGWSVAVYADAIGRDGVRTPTLERHNFERPLIGTIFGRKVSVKETRNGEQDEGAPAKRTRFDLNPPPMTMPPLSSSSSSSMMQLLQPPHQHFIAAAAKRGRRPAAADWPFSSDEEEGPPVS